MAEKYNQVLYNLEFNNYFIFKVGKQQSWTLINGPIMSVIVNSHNGPT